MSKQVAGRAQLTALARERLATLFNTHADRLYRLGRRLTPGADDALDLVQETFLKVAKSPALVPVGAAAEEAWLVRILVNIRRDQWRREAVRRRGAPYLRRILTVHPESTYVVQLAVWQGLDSLSPRRRAILVMHELEGMPVPAIASLLGIAAITVRWHLARARREMGRRIRLETGVTNEQTQKTVAGGRPATARGSSKP